MLTRKVILFSFLFFVILSASSNLTASTAFAMQTKLHTSKQLPPPVVTISIQPDAIPVKFAIDSNGNISFGISNQIQIEELGFVVDVSASQSIPLIPQLSPQAQQASISESSLLLIIRHKQNGSLEDANYLLQGNQTIQSVDITGDISEVSVKRNGQSFLVFVDASSGAITGINLQGVPPGTNSAVKTGCPSVMMVEWSMNLSQGSVNQIGGLACAFTWNNNTGGGADGNCPVGYGPASVQLSFPWWHFWDSNETHNCDGKSAETIDDMGVADSATITFQVSTTNATATSSSSTAIQTCKVVLADGLNIRADPTSQSILIAHYPSGTILNYVQVVNGENYDGKSLWGLSAEGHYFWLGGTDHPNG